jgi:hypothetical protein
MFLPPKNVSLLKCHLKTQESVICAHYIEVLKQESVRYMSDILLIGEGKTSIDQT